MGEHKHWKKTVKTVLTCCVVAGLYTGLGNVAFAEDPNGGIFEDGSESAPGVNSPAVKVGSFGQVDLHVKDLEVTKVLQLLSIQSQRNIMASRNVAGTVSADLYGVDFYEALDAVLHTNGFGYQEKGNLIFVYTTAELQQIEETQRKLVHRVVRLNYISAADASTFVTPLLSSAGSIAVSGDVSAGFQPSVSDGGANTFAHTDTLIINDYADNVDEIVSVIVDLDKRPQQVLVEATVLQARLTEENAFGVDLSVLADFAVSNFADPLGIVDEVISGSTTLPDRTAGAHTTVGNTTTGTSGIKVGISTHNVAAFIRALDSVTDTTVLANPKLLVLNRQKADLLVGEKLGYLSSTATDTSTTQTVEFLDVGTQLTLRPFVSEDGFIRIELKPSISDGDTTRTVGNFVIPETTNQELVTNVVVRNGQTVVLGGLFKEDTTVSRRQVPLLGDIPILGALFKGQDDTVNRNEVIFLITPTIMKDESLYAIGERAQDRIESARLGAREGLLPWSRTKMTATHMREAEKFLSKGDTQKAIWAVNMALTLDPKHDAAIELKQKLTGQRLYEPASFSILNNVMDEMIHGQPAGALLPLVPSWSVGQPGAAAPAGYPSFTPSNHTRPSSSLNLQNQPALPSSPAAQSAGWKSTENVSAQTVKPAAQPVAPAADSESFLQEDSSAWDDILAPQGNVQAQSQTQSSSGSAATPVSGSSDPRSQIQSWMNDSNQFQSQQPATNTAAQPVVSPAVDTWSNPVVPENTPGFDDQSTFGSQTEMQEYQQYTGSSTGTSGQGAGVTAAQDDAAAQEWESESSDTETSSDPFNAVVEWLLASPSEEQE